nr:RNA polymerase sigma factor SigF [Gemmatimonadales bacterium]
AIGELEPRDRLLLTLRFEQELSAREIAGLMGLATPFHVYRRLNRICEGLRERLSGNGSGPRD